MKNYDETLYNDIGNLTDFDGFTKTYVWFQHQYY